MDISTARDRPLDGTLPVGADRAPAAPRDMVDAANGFEAIFMRQLMSAMRQGKLGDDIFSGPQTEQFESMQYDNIADTMAKSGDFGIAEMLLARFRQGGGDLPS